MDIIIIGFIFHVMYRPSICIVWIEPSFWKLFPIENFWIGEDYVRNIIPNGSFWVLISDQLITKHLDCILHEW